MDLIWCYISLYEFIAQQAFLCETLITIGHSIYPDDSLLKQILAHHCALHTEITPAGLSGQRFHAPLHIFPPTPGLSCTTGGGGARWRHLMELC